MGELQLRGSNMKSHITQGLTDARITKKVTFFGMNMMGVSRYTQVQTTACIFYCHLMLMLTLVQLNFREGRHSSVKLTSEMHFDMLDSLTFNKSDYLPVNFQPFETKHGG
jgi:hypothetical protein